MIVKMTEDALENYGEQWRNVEFRVIHTATKYMPAKEFFATGSPNGYHPGYSEDMRGMPLYDLELTDGTEFHSSLYKYEVVYLRRD